LDSYYAAYVERLYERGDFSRFQAGEMRESEVAKTAYFTAF